MIEEESSELTGDASEGLSPDEVKEQYFRAIVENIFNADEAKRREAIHLIQYFECDPRLAEPLSTLLRAEDPAWALTGIEGLGLWRHSDAATLLIQYYQSARFQTFRTEISEEALLVALGYVGGIESLEFLKAYAVERYDAQTSEEDALGMAAVEGITQIAMRGHSNAIEFLLSRSSHPAWNFREACADGFSVIFAGKKELPKAVYDRLMLMTKDDNKDVRIAAYLALDAIVGLDEKNKEILNNARHRQVFGS